MDVANRTVMDVPKNSRRSSARLPLTLAAELRLAGKRHVLQTKDVGVNGAFLITDQDIGENEPLEVGLILPPRFIKVTVKAAIAHRVSGDEARRRQTPAGLGVRFFNDGTEDWEAWRLFVEEITENRVEEKSLVSSPPPSLVSSPPLTFVSSPPSTLVSSPPPSLASSPPPKSLPHLPTTPRTRTPYTTCYLSPKDIAGLRHLLQALVSGRGFLIKGGKKRPGNGRARIIISHPATQSQFALYASTEIEEKGMTRLKPAKLTALELQALYWFVDSGLSIHTKPKTPRNGTKRVEPGWNKQNGTEWTLPADSLSWNVID